MEDIFYCKYLHESVQDDARPTNKTDKECDLMYRKTVAYIRKWVDQSVIHHVFKESRADVL